MKRGKYAESTIVCPIEYMNISKFSHRRLHPIKKVYTTHYGVDYAAPSGTEVVATGDGKVTFAGRAGGAGNMIKIKTPLVTLRPNTCIY